MGDTIFGKILRKEIPAEIIYEDEQAVVFKDVHPQAPTHLVLIPKKEIASVDAVEEGDVPVVGHLLWAARKIARELGLSDGYRLVTNCGKNAGQEVMHLHFHLLAGRPFHWPPG